MEPDQEPSRLGQKEAREGKWRRGVEGGNGRGWGSREEGKKVSVEVGARGGEEHGTRGKAGKTREDEDEDEKKRKRKEEEEKRKRMRL